MPNDFSGNPPFETVAPPSQSVPLILNSPHSGSCYPKAFLASSRLDERSIRRSEDSFVDELFQSAVDFGAPLLRANFPRAWLDVNREPYELDPNMFDGKLPPFANVRSVRVAGGLGTIARIVSESEEIYAAPLDVAEGLARIEQVYKPYHAALEGLVAATHTAFGQVLLIDCHSMPSTVRGGQSRLRPDIVLGDRYGASCSGQISDAASHILSRLGYSISRNKPYAGGFITEHYGKPGLGIHAMQIEVNRCLYMDERTLRQTAGFSRLKADLAVFIAELAALFGDGVLVPADAAE
jgi:N-formylglutamate amidohydrolase